MKIKANGQVVGQERTYLVGTQLVKVPENAEIRTNNIRALLKAIRKLGVPVQKDELDSKVIRLNEIRDVYNLNIRNSLISNNFIAIIKNEDVLKDIDQNSSAYRQYAILTSRMQKGKDEFGQEIEITVKATRADIALTKSDAAVIRKSAIENIEFYLFRERVVKPGASTGVKGWEEVKREPIKGYNAVRQEVIEREKVTLRKKFKVITGTKITDKYGNKGVITVISDEKFDKLCKRLRIKAKIDMIWNPSLEKRGINAYKSEVHEVKIKFAEPPQNKIYRNITLSTGWMLLRGTKIYNNTLSEDLRRQVNNVIACLFDKEIKEDCIEINTHLGSDIVRGVQIIDIDDPRLENTVMDKRTETKFSVIKLHNGNKVYLPPLKLAKNRDDEYIVDELRRRFNRIILRINTPSGAGYIGQEIKAYKKELSRYLTGKNGLIRKYILPKSQNSWMLVAVPAIKEDVIVPNWMIETETEYAYVFRHPIHCCSDIIPVKIKRGNFRTPVIKIKPELIKKMCGDFDGDQIGIILPKDEDERIEIIENMKNWQNRMFPEEELEKIKSRVREFDPNQPIEDQIKDGIIRKMAVKRTTAINGAYGIRLMCEAIEKDKDIDEAAFIYKIAAQDSLEYKHRDLPANLEDIGELALANNPNFTNSVKEALDWHDETKIPLLFQVLNKKVVLSEESMSYIAKQIKKLREHKNEEFEEYEIIEEEV